MREATQIAYYLRALLPEWQPRPLGELAAYAEGQGHAFRITEAEPDDPHWRRALLNGSESRDPVEIEVALDDDELLSEELGELRDEAEDGKPRRARKKVKSHLDETTAIVAVRVPTADLDTGLEIAGAVIAYYAERPGVLIHADGEGFYVERRLVLGTD